ncbi:unnamed protein product, partial [Alternaria alternata]
MKMPNSDSFEEVHKARLVKGSWSNGDSGAVVMHPTRGITFGHILGGNRATGVALILAANKVVEEFRELDFSSHLHLNVSNAWRTHMPEVIGETIGTKTSNFTKADSSVPFSEHLFTNKGYLLGQLTATDDSILEPLQASPLGKQSEDSQKRATEVSDRQTLARRENVFGRENPETLDTVNNQGKLDEAEEMLMRALQRKEIALEPDHPSTLDASVNLGALYKAQGRLDKAEQVYERALQGYEEAFEPNHMSTLQMVNNLGNLYADQGRLGEAEQMLMRALRGYEKALGVGHSSTLNTVNNLGLLYANQGRLSEAEQMYERALRGYEALGLDNNAPTLNTVNNLGNLYADQGRLGKAEQMLMRALQGKKKAFGREHPDTLTSMANLASTYRNQGRWDEAEKLEVQVIETSGHYGNALQAASQGGYEAVVKLLLDKGADVNAQGGDYALLKEGQDARMSSPHHHTTTYDGNTIDGNAIAILGNVHGDIHFPDRAGDTEQQQCLRDLSLTDPRKDRARIEGDKDRLLKDCYAWLLDDASFQRWRMQDASRLLWIKGDPGKGKTMMTMGVIDELSQPRPSREALLEAPVLSNNSTPLVSFFFCQSTIPALNNAVSVLRGLIYMLVKQRDSLLRYVQEEYEVAGKQLFNGHNAIYSLRSILSNILNDASLPPTYLIVDALDECTSGLSELLQIITDASVGRRSKVKWLVTSRNIPEIGRYLQPDSAGDKVSLEVKASHVSRAVAAFVDYKVERLATVQKYDRRLQAEVQQQLRDKAEGTFLWVSLVCKELEKVPFYRTRKVLEELPPGLNPLYDRMMSQITAEDAETARYCKDILRTITLALRPLQLEELAATVGLLRDEFGDVQAVADLVSRCGSFLTVREDIISFVHLSAKDFFTLGNGRQVFDGTPAEEQGRMTDHLLNAMDSTLRRDMCSLQKPGVRILQAMGRVQNSCLPQIAYACEYWVEHLQAGRHACSDVVADEGKVHRFFQKHLLHWLEAMSLLQKMPEAILALQKLEATLNVSGRLARQV